jgi:outer membrane protein assembly factor BamB
LAAVAVCVPALAVDRADKKASSRQAWSTEFEHAVEFQALVDTNVLVVGTTRHLFGIDPRTGAERWRKRDLHVKPEDLLPVPGTRLLLVNEDYGGKFADRETSFLALDAETGAELWESKVVKGKGMQAVADPASNLLLLVTVKEPHGDDKGLFAGWLPGDGIGGGFERTPKLTGLDLSTGKKLWDRDFDSDVDMRPSLEAELARGGDKKQKDRPFDLGLYRPPVIEGGQIFVTYHGISCYDARTGERLWRQEYGIREGDLALSDADPIVDGEVVYTSGEGRIRAVDRRTGKVLWRSDDFGVVPELFVDDHVLYGQLGGRFYNPFSDEWSWKGNFGAVAIDRATGKRIWRYDDGSDSVTNLTIAGDRVWLGDADRLVGLDRSTGKRVVAEPHELEKRPVLSSYNERDEIVLIGDEEVAGFSVATGKRAWYARHEPIKPSGWRRFAAGLMMTSGAVLTVASFAAAKVKGLLPAVPSPAVRVSGLAPITLLNTKSIAIRTGSRVGKALWSAGSGMLGVTRFAHLTGTHQYFLTRLDGTDQALAGVNLTTGETDRAVELPSPTPNIVIDEVGGNVMQARGRRLIAFPL